MNSDKFSGSLFDQLAAYAAGDACPMHMPGHKRKALGSPLPLELDITEITGFDNLHEARGILRQGMDRAARLWGSRRAYYLINGSSGGILAGIAAAAAPGSRVILARGCHKSVYHALELRGLRPVYLQPDADSAFGVAGSVQPDQLAAALEAYPDAGLVILTSPTYEGVVSDIAALAALCHRRGIPLLVDEAHGAHLGFDPAFPAGGVACGADIVVQSLHKTLPCFTQTAVLHIKGDRVKAEEIERYLRIYQSSSPSYVFLAGIENCIFHMDREGRQRMERFYENVCRMRTNLKKMHRLYLLDREWIGSYGVFDMDMSKIVVSVEKTDLTGADLDRILRERYHLELEMCCADHVVAITSLGDREEGFRRLEEALLELDGQLNDRDEDPELESNLEWSSRVTSRPEVEMTIFEGIMAQKESVPVEEGVGRIAGEFVFIYPPGIPIVAPGEMLLPSLVHTIEEYQEMGLSVQGLKDLSGKTIQVVKRL